MPVIAGDPIEEADRVIMVLRITVLNKEGQDPPNFSVEYARKVSGLRNIFFVIPLPCKISLFCIIKAR